MTQLGTIAIADTAANVSANIDALNADTDVTAITLTGTGTPTLALTVAQALDDTHALGAITNASYAIDVIDTPANIAANFDALNADTHVTSIAPRGGGTQTLTLTLAQALTDTRALSILDPFTVTIIGAAAGIEALTTTQIAGSRQRRRHTARSKRHRRHIHDGAAASAGRGGNCARAAFCRGGSVEVLNYFASGVLESAEYLGIVGRAYTSYTITTERAATDSASYSNGMTAAGRTTPTGHDVARGRHLHILYGRLRVKRRPDSASYSNGMTRTWTYDADGSYQVAWAGVTGEPYTAYTVQHAANGQLTTAVYNNGMTATWTHNADGSYQGDWAGVTGEPYTAYTVQYAANGQLTTAVLQQWDDGDRGRTMLMGATTAPIKM